MRLGRGSDGRWADRQVGGRGMTGARLKVAAATRYRPAEVTAGRRRYQPRPDRQNPQSKEATMPTNSTAQLLTIEQLAEQLTTSIRHIRRLIAERRIPYIKVGHLVRFDPAEIDEWIDWGWHGLTDIHQVGRSPRKDVQNGDCGEEEAPAPPFVHPGVQG